MDWDDLSSLFTDGGESVDVPTAAPVDSLQGIDASAAGTGVDPSINPVNYTGPDLTNWLASKGKDDPSFIENLASQLGVGISKNPMQTIGLIVGALGSLRSQAGGANRENALMGVNNVVQKQSANPYTSANEIINSGRTPTYRQSSQFIVTPPKSTGPLTLIKTGGK